jgi:hypothetical protein
MSQERPTSGDDAEKPQNPDTTGNLGGLVVPSEKFWSEISSEQRIVLLEGFDTRYQQQLDELYSAANLCVDKF